MPVVLVWALRCLNDGLHAGAQAMALGLYAS
jgi:hypothetical protein